MHDLAGDVVVDDGMPVTPCPFVMRLEVLIVLTAQPAHRCPMDLQQELGGQCQRARIEAVVDEIECLDVVDEFDFGSTVSLKLTPRSALGLDQVDCRLISCNLPTESKINQPDMQAKDMDLPVRPRNTCRCRFATATRRRPEAW